MGLQRETIVCGQATNPAGTTNLSRHTLTNTLRMPQQLKLSQPRLGGMFRLFVNVSITAVLSGTRAGAKDVLTLFTRQAVFHIFPADLTTLTSQFVIIAHCFPFTKICRAGNVPATVTTNCAVLVTALIIVYCSGYLAENKWFVNHLSFYFSVASLQVSLLGPATFVFAEPCFLKSSCHRRRSFHSCC